MSYPKTVVIGLDGGHFELINPWLAQGKLPNIKRAIETGISSDLNSVLPPVTSPNWKAYATGKNPGKLGIFWWENIDVENKRVYYPSERKNAHTEFWDLIGENEPVGVIGVPTTYPPKPISEFFVSGAPDGDNSNYTHPNSLEERLSDKYDYRVTMRNRLSVNRDAAIDEILELIDTRFQVGKELAKEYDVSLLQITTFYLNSLQHFLWDDEATLRGWQIIDEHIGDFIESDSNLILMSDHGSTEIQTVFNVNTWLEQEGYLALDSGIADYLYNAGITTDRLIQAAYFFRIPRLAERLVPDRLLRKIPNEDGELSREGKADLINWEKTKAIASGQGPVYLTIDPENDDYEQIRTEIANKIKSVSSPEGNKIADEVHRAEGYYTGEYLDEAPDLIIDQKNGVHIGGAIGNDELFSTPKTDEWRAENKREGMFVASGPDFGDQAPADLSIMDLAPMLLHLHGCSVPEDMDGTVPKSVFADHTPPSKRDVEYQTASIKSRELRRIQNVARKIDL